MLLTSGTNSQITGVRNTHDEEVDNKGIINTNEIYRKNSENTLYKFLYKLIFNMKYDNNEY